MPLARADRVFHTPSVGLKMRKHVGHVGQQLPKSRLTCKNKLSHLPKQGGTVGGTAEG